MLSTEYQEKSDRYRAVLTSLGREDFKAQTLVERLTAPPFDPAVDASGALPSLLATSAPQELPVASLRELERAYRRPAKARRLTLGLQRLAARCPEHMLNWLHLSPSRLCRLAFVLGGMADDKALAKAQRHSLFLFEPRDGWMVEGLIRIWFPLRPPQALADCAQDPTPRRLFQVQQHLTRWLDLARLELVFHYIAKSNPGHSL